MKQSQLFFYATAVLLFLFSGVQLEAKIKMPAIFGSNMVLQQKSDVLVWGDASPGKTVKIVTSWDNKQYQTNADQSGKFSVKIQTPVYGGPFNMTISDGSTLKLDNIMIGEVWLCSGQSNMEMPLAGWGKIQDYEKEIAAAKYPNIRLFQVEKNTSTIPLNDVTVAMGGWQECSPQTIPEFSSVAYFFARDIYENTKIPVGLIHSSWGGTIAEAWTSSASLKAMPDFKDAVLKMEEKSQNQGDAKAQYDKEFAEWEQQTLAKDRGYKNNTPQWLAIDYNDSGWKKMMIPDNWENKALPDFDGVVWFRKVIDIPAAWKNKKLTLYLGEIDDNDITYFNGVEVGRTNGWDMKRTYTIPSNLVKEGKAVITVRVLDNTGGGGMYGANPAIRLAGNSSGEIPLSGDWAYEIGYNATEVTPAPKSWNDPNRPTVLFNAMLRPLIPFAIKGAIWYQGEANDTRAYQYRELLPLMIRDWRKQWDSDFPFYFVQLASFRDRQVQPVESAWAELREAQLQTLHLEKTGMAVTIDIGDAKDIHPKNKQDVGKRLALLARAQLYGQTVACSGPVYDSYEIEGNTIRIYFRNTDGGLQTKDQMKLKGFEIAGSDHQFKWATAVIQGNEIVVSCEGIEFPVAVRYGWSDHPDCNLYNQSGLPASPFRTDDWPGVTFGKK